MLNAVSLWVNKGLKMKLLELVQPIAGEIDTNYFQLIVFTKISESIPLTNAERLVTGSSVLIYTRCLFFTGISGEENKRI